MIIKSKKGDIPTLKTIVIILITTIIFISFVLLLMKTTSLTIEDKKLQTQIIQNKIFNSDCFSQEYGIIEENKFTQDNFNSCFKNMPANIAFKVQILGKSEITINPNVYKQKESYCGRETNLLCSTMKYPITLKSNSDELSSKTLTILTIVN